MIEHALKEGDWLKRCLLVGAFLLLIGGIGKLVQFRLPSDGANTKLFQSKSVAKASHQSEPRPSLVTGVAPHISIHVDASQHIQLLANNTPRRLVLEKLAERLKFQVVATSDAEPQLDQLIAIEVSGSLDGVVQELLFGIEYKSLLVQGGQATAKEKLFYCLGKGACSNVTALLAVDESASPAATNSIAPSEQFQQAIAMEFSPDSNGGLTPMDMVQRAAVLKAEFRNASAATKVEIIQAIDVRPNLDFMLDALHFEQDTQVRQAAARELYLPDNDRAISALLSSLDDPSDGLVVTVIDVLSESDDEALRSQVTARVGSHRNQSIQKMLKDLSFL